MNKHEAIKKTKLYLFDMDGTLYLGDRLYDFTIELLQTIKACGGKYLFMTNNSSKSVLVSYPNDSIPLLYDVSPALELEELVELCISISLTSNI